MTEIKGYKVLSIRLPTSKEAHHLFFKKHEMKGQGDEGDRSIFFSNLPINTNTQTIKKLFQEVAIGATVEKFIPSYLTDTVEDTFLDLTKLTSDLEIDSHIDEISSKLPRNCGVVMFIDKAAFQLAMTSLKQLSSKSTIVDWPLNKSEYGSSYFLNKYKSQMLDIDLIANEVNQALMDFDKAEQQSIDDFKQQSELVDEDGFTLVVGPQRKTKAGIMGQQQLATNKAVSEQAQAKMKKKEKQDFYRFQLRERKKEEMNELLRKFKSDQEKVKTMRDKKRFRPY